MSLVRGVMLLLPAAETVVAALGVAQFVARQEHRRALAKEQCRQHVTLAAGARLEDLGVILIPRLNIPIGSLKPGLDIPRLANRNEARDKGRETGISDIGFQLYGSPYGWDLFGWKIGAGP